MRHKLFDGCLTFEYKEHLCILALDVCRHNEYRYRLPDNPEVSSVRVLALSFSR